MLYLNPFPQFQRVLASMIVLASIIVGGSFGQSGSRRVTVTDKGFY